MNFRLLAVAAGLLALNGLAPRQTRSDPARPNVVYILADDLGWGDLRCYNPDGKIPTPHLDRLAAEGMRFTDAHSPSAVCTPTRYGILTGRYCWRSALKSGVLYGYDQPLIEPGRPTVASLLHRAGYHTACIGKWHLGLPWALDPTSGYRHDPATYHRATRHDVRLDQPLGRGGPVDVGFDEFYGIPASLDIEPYGYLQNRQFSRPLADSVPAQTQNDPDYARDFWRAGAAEAGFSHQQTLPRLTGRAVAYLQNRRNQKAPFFLYLPLTAPHTPWVPEARFRGKSKAGKYGDFVVATDWAVGQVLDALAQNGLAANTLVIVTSDNGSHTQHIGQQHGHRANGPWRGQKADIHEGGHRVPFLVRWPGRVRAGSVSDETICLTDLMATVAALTSQRLPAQSAPDSYDLSPVLLGKRYEKPLREATVHHSLDGMFAIRQGDWKLIRGLGSGGFTAPVRDSARARRPGGQLYNLRADPAETQNRYADEPAMVARLSALLEKYQRQGHSR